MRNKIISPRRPNNFPSSSSSRMINKKIPGRNYRSTSDNHLISNRTSSRRNRSPMAWPTIATKAPPSIKPPRPWRIASRCSSRITFTRPICHAPRVLRIRRATALIKMDPMLIIWPMGMLLPLKGSHWIEIRGSLCPWRMWSGDTKVKVVFRK